MPTTDTTERGLEDLIVADLTAGSAPAAVAVDLAQLGAFLRATQPKKAEALDLGRRTARCDASSSTGSRAR